MKYVPDPTGRFVERPFFTDEEIDAECEDMIDQCLENRGKAPFAPPLDNDTLHVLLEMYAEDVNLYADLAATEGNDVEGVTEFRKGKMPRISIDKRLSQKSTSLNRLRSTMAHELFHARFHRVLWELHWRGQSGSAGCHQGQILLSGKTDWYEWQAAYGSGAILIPRSALMKLVGSIELRGESSPEGRALVCDVSSVFQVSEEAARVRLVQLNLLESALRNATRV